MKKIIQSFIIFMVSLSGFSQNAFMHYVTVKNSDVNQHIEAEKNVHAKYWQEQINQGNKIGWDMWQISNNSYDEPTTTFLYVHFNNPEASGNNDSSLSDHELAVHRKGYRDRVVKEGSLVVNIKASHGISPGDIPPNNMVINYMNVDFYKGYEYEMMEKSVGPNYKDNGRAAWGFAKILNRFGSKHNVQYLTFDFYNSMEQILNIRTNTPNLTKTQINEWKKQDDLRTIYNTHMLTLVAYARAK
tara:strand:+ start:138 stop:869 length:732 start_codon:yes stop_codon:yes gene_type:complete